MEDKKITFQDIFSMQRLLLDQKDQKKLQSAVVAIAGIGGIGCAALELLARNGIGNFKLADHDIYEPTNARQLFMTQKALGKSKLSIVRNRLLDINPNVHVRLYPSGITIKNYMNFCRGVDIVCAQTDLITSQLLLYMGASNYHIPLLHAGRARWPNRHLVSVSTYHHRKGSGRFSLEKLGINPSKWGVRGTGVLKKFVDYAKKGKDCPRLEEKINTQNKKFRIESFLRAIMKKDISSLSEKNREYLLQVAKSHPNNFYKMAITPELCFVSGALLTTTVKDIILGRVLKRVAVDLYNGKVFENY